MPQKHPSSLYIHIPWCIKKCPYCDFNSHQLNTSIPESDFLTALLSDLENDLTLLDASVEISTIFIGGGTPSLMSGRFYSQLFSQIAKRLSISKDAEITLEANPGTVESQHFKEYHASGINRLSLGIQSFNAKSLHQLGRIHDDKQAHNAINRAFGAGFDNINIDIMHSLPLQTVGDGLEDLRVAIDYGPTHISWYQLTIEPNTYFYNKTPALPTEKTTLTIERDGLSLLQTHGYNRYEISAFTTNEQKCRHNLNYWQFGDYLGIGPGAHGKLSTDNGVIRTQKHRMPKDYLNPNKPYRCDTKILSNDSLIFEAMLNLTRLEGDMPLSLLAQKTGVPITNFLPKLMHAASKELIELSHKTFRVTPFGRRFTNDLQLLFL
jgi:putative oxygen-independent coproporphyrinogen III oxidase